MNSENKSKKVAVTAGLRGASWNAERMKAPFNSVPMPLVTQDGQSVMGMLFSRGGEKNVAFVMHPRELVLTHYLVPEILDAGWACWVQGARTVGNDLRLEHEFALYDVAAGMKQLRSIGFEKVVLMGNSGGAGLFAFYNQQSLLLGENRISRTPGGRPTKLESAELPVADGLGLVSPHPGQGALLMNALDPSVLDENDPFSVDATLDPFSPANGFSAPPDSSKYSEDFIGKYRAAQRDRVQRIDDHAKNLINRKMSARKRIKERATRADRQLAGHGPIFQVWRTDADLRCWDTSIDPSDRYVGSLWGGDPYVSNFGSVGFGRTVTPESWLSTWSGISSSASMEKCASFVEQPSILIEYTGDNCVFPADADKIFSDLASSKKERHKVRGNHHGQPLSDEEQSGQEIAGEHIRRWLKATF